MARKYRTPLDKRIQYLQQRVAAKNRYHLNKHDLQLNDPRISNISSLTGSQKAAYARRLQAHIDAKQIRGAGGSAIDARKYGQAQKLIKQWNKRVERIINKHGDKKLPSGNTVRENYDVRFQSRLLGMKTTATHAPHTYAPINRSPSSFPSNKSIDRFIKTMKEKLSGKDEKRKARNLKKTALDMLAQTGNTDMMKKVRKMNANQLSFLMNITEFVSEVSFMYDEFKKGRKSNVSNMAQSQAAESVELALAEK